jgi:hypothetical protein
MDIKFAPLSRCAPHRCAARLRPLRATVLRYSNVFAIKFGARSGRTPN